MNKQNLFLLVAVLIITVGAGAFFAGIKYQEGKRPRFGNFQDERTGQFQQRQGARPVSGEIISADDKSITVKLSDGSSKIAVLSESTVINKSAQGSREDLKTGERVFVFGTENPDGSVTAQNIQLNPAERH